MKRILIGFAALFGLVATAAGQVVPFPQSLPPSTVIGRMPPVSGPAQAIPFSVFSTNLTASLFGFTTNGDSDLVIPSTSRVVATSAALTTTRTWTLPASLAMIAGQQLCIADQAGGVTGTNTLTIARASADTIDGATSYVLRSAFAGACFIPDGVSKWTVNIVPTAGGGTGVSSFTANGVLYGNGVSSLQVTAQGAANTVLAANAGAPAFSASPTIGTSVTTPIVLGGTASSSTLTLGSTSAGPVTDSILFKNGTVQTASFEYPTVTGPVGFLGSITPGTGYTNGTYNGVALTGGTGSGATANITVAGGVVTVVTLVNAGTNYTFADNLSATAASIGGTGSGFSVKAGVGNSTVAASGSTLGFYHANEGSCDNVDSIPNTKFATPGISPSPSSGLMFVMGCYADSTLGNISNIFSVASSNGTRLVAAMTGIGFAPIGATNTQIWGGQFSAVFRTTAGGIGQGANIECDSGSGTVTCIGVTIKLGDSGTGGTNLGNSFINLIADAGRGASNGIRFQTNSVASTGNVVLAEAPFTAVNGVNFSAGTFTGCVFMGPNNSCIYGAGDIQTLVTTVAALPTCNAARKGSHAFVTNGNTANAFRGAVTAGGALQQWVTCDGTSWLQG
jgi:hypothetical protein